MPRKRAEPPKQRNPIHGATPAGENSVGGEVLFSLGSAGGEALVVGQLRDDPTRLVLALSEDLIEMPAACCSPTGEINARLDYDPDANTCGSFRRSWWQRIGSGAITISPRYLHESAHVVVARIQIVRDEIPGIRIGHALTAGPSVVLQLIEPALRERHSSILVPCGEGSRCAQCQRSPQDQSIDKRENPPHSPI